MTKSELRQLILKTLEKEGGAAALKALIKASNTSKKDLKTQLSKMKGVAQHQDGDYISTPINEKKKGLDGKACWDGYKLQGTKMKNGKRVDNCVKMEEDINEETGKCTPSQGKRFAKRINGKCRSFGQAGKAKKGGDRIRPGTAKGNAYCARSAKIKKCKNPPCANALSRKKWKCQGSRSVAEINEVRMLQIRAGIISENINLNKMQDIELRLVDAGFSFDDGILGGVGSGGAGYYDFISDKISGFRINKFDEKEFNKWYDGFNKDSFSSFTYTKEFSKDNEDGIDYETISDLKPGIYQVNEPGYGGFAEIHDNGDVTLYASPTISDDNGYEFKPIFSLNNDGSIKQEMSKEEVKKLLQQNIQTPGSWSII